MDEPPRSHEELDVGGRIAPSDYYDLQRTEPPGSPDDELWSIGESGQAERTINLARGPFPGPREVARRREATRSGLAWGVLLAIIGLVVFLIVLLVTRRISLDTLERLAALFIGPLFGILGTVVAFYFKDKGGGGA